MTIPEQVLLLAVRDGESKFETYGYHIGAALLAALLVHERVEVVSGKKNKVAVVDATPLADAVLDGCLSQVAGRRKSTRAHDWVLRLSSKRNYHAIATVLCGKKVLQAKDARNLYFFKRRAYDLVDLDTRDRLVERLKVAVFSDTSDLHIDNRLLVALAYAGELLPLHFNKKLIRKRTRHLKHIVQGDSVSETVARALKTARQVSGLGSNTGVVAVAGMSS